MNWRSGRSNSPPGTGGVARSAGVVDGSNDSPPPFVNWNQREPFRLYYHPGPSGHPSCSRRGVVPPSPMTAPTTIRMQYPDWITTPLALIFWTELQDQECIALTLYISDSPSPLLPKILVLVHILRTADNQRNALMERRGYD